MFDRSVFLKSYEDLIFYSLCASTNTKLTAGMYLTGEYYGSTENKLLVVGRALNGWEDTYCWYTHDTHIDIKVLLLKLLEHGMNKHTEQKLTIGIPAKYSLRKPNYPPKIAEGLNGLDHIIKTKNEARKVPLRFGACQKK